MAQIILILAMIIALVVGAVFLVEAWNNQQDAQAQRLAAEARLSMARAEGDAMRIQAGAEAASTRSDATGRMLMALFPWLVFAGLAGLAMFVGFPILTNYLERRQNVSPHSDDTLALAALGRMFLAMQRQERLPLPAREVEVLESRKEIASQ